MDHRNPAELRKPYTGEPLRRSSLAAHPMTQFDLWFDEAYASGLGEPNAMVLASVEPTGMPRARTVLLKGYDRTGLRFFTNYTSRKARALDADPRASVLFPWHAIRRQVLVAGRVERLSDAENDLYFASRPRGSQLGAWASERQSRPVEGRAELDRLYRGFETVWPEDEEIPRPSYWGGFRLLPEEVEFWQGGADRMHDRFRYLRGDGDDWEIDRLSP
ncbi:pyridoxamine 5'-phosphate oxidase [Nocardiopsis sp. CT-R113]|uniref:Pyridoxine/pyridoxamine 5'-phosphate oxidase n=1 Tax=Nocardiopsis codii TaxID=3065942 RepID=A0ABU7K2X5_9ACTN|nr:pyridoxamine 5'-phosphate oxidase [Nocardiopsis sp. CT-R113]MEE2036596.1 pyridoxamine 5'-phosphate oxidase [Nocardiopsis sp. CT-R113]